MIEEGSVNFEDFFFSMELNGCDESMVNFSHPRAYFSIFVQRIRGCKGQFENNVTPTLLKGVPRTSTYRSENLIKVLKLCSPKHE